MAFTYDGVAFPDGNDQHDWHTDMRRLAESTKGVPAVSSAAARDALAAAASTAQTPATADNPVYVYRADTGAIEVTTNGSTWVGVELGDTGWVGLTRGAGLSAGVINYRKKNGVVHVFVDVTIATATSAALIATLPTLARPVFNYPGAAEGGTIAPRLIVEAGGAIQLLWIGNGSGVRARGALTFPVGA